MNSVSNNSLLIIGCGWVGKKLGQRYAKNGYKVYGTTRSESRFTELRNHNIQPVRLELPADNISDIRLPLADTIVISISPGSRRGDRSHYTASIRQLAQLLAVGNAQVILYSSSSVYKNANGIVKEEDALPNKVSENAILAAEGELRAQIPDAVILRLSGLYGEDRHPVKYLSGRKDIKNGDAPVNLVHRDDVVGATELVIEKNIRDEIFNVCSPEHPAKREIYTTIARQLDMEPPAFLDGGQKEKEVSSQKLIKQFGFRFLHKNPMKFQQKSLES